MSKNNFSFLANSDGKPIVQGNTKDKNIDWIGIQKWLSKSSVGTSTTSTRLNKDGSEFILFASLIPNAGIWFVSGINRQLLMGKEKIVLKYLALILVFGFTLSFVFSNFLGRFFSKPFDQITYALKQLQLGNLSYRIPYNKNNEFGYLCHLINVLAEKILKDRIIGNFWSNKEELKKIKRGDKL